MSLCGTHLAPRVSAGPQQLDQVGLETDTWATVTSCAVLEVVGTLTEARAAAGDGIESLKKMCVAQGAAVARVGKT